MLDDSEPILRVYWYEIREISEFSFWWGQLAGGMHRLVAVREEFEELRRIRDVEKALRRLELYLEVYLTRAYEIGERVRGLLASVTHGSEDVKKFRDKIRHKDKRAEALSRLCVSNPLLSSTLSELLEFLDTDRDLRNVHTHEHYLSLGVGEGLHDPWDGLLYLSDQPSELRRLKSLLRLGIKHASENYLAKTKTLITLTKAVLESAPP